MLVTPIIPGLAVMNNIVAAMQAPLQVPPLGPVVTKRLRFRVKGLDEGL